MEATSVRPMVYGATSAVRSDDQREKQAMLLKFYGFQQQPFGVTPDSRCLFLSASYRQALTALFYGIEARQGFMALSGKPGTGKTTLLNHLLDEYRDVARTAFVFQTQCDSQQLLRYISAELYCGCEGRDPVLLHEKLNKQLLRTLADGKPLILIIDEAHNLAEPVLETIRLLSDFETQQKKLLQIILAGQPELTDKLASPSLVALRQRISISCSLDPLTSEETGQYISHRLCWAGYKGGPLFTPEACELIADTTEGIPRKINHLCARALSLGCTLGQETIDTSIVNEVGAGSDLAKLAPPSRGDEILAEKEKPKRTQKSQATSDESSSVPFGAAEIARVRDPKKLSIESKRNYLADLRVAIAESNRAEYLGIGLHATAPEARSPILGSTLGSQWDYSRLFVYVGIVALIFAVLYALFSNGQKV